MIAAGALAGGCVDGEPRPTMTMTATATIEDTLPVDGCSVLITIGDEQYAPDRASLVAIRASELGAFAEVTIRYHLTGSTGEVECGWRTLLTLPEIALVLID
jgi:hypothetical protein